MPDPTTQPEEKEKQVPDKFQLELIDSESADRLDKKSGPWDAIKMYEFDAAKGLYVTNALDKRHLEEKQLELYETNP